VPGDGAEKTGQMIAMNSPRAGIPPMESQRHDRPGNESSRLFCGVFRNILSARIIRHLHFLPFWPLGPLSAPSLIPFRRGFAMVEQCVSHRCLTCGPRSVRGFC